MGTPKITDLSSSMAAVGTMQTQADALVDVASIISAVYDSTNQVVKTSASISGDVNVDNTALSITGLIGRNSGADFTASFASATTLTIGSLPDGSTLTAADIVAIIQINNSGSVVGTFTRDDKTMSISAGTLTVTGVTFAATDTFIIFTSISRGTTGDVAHDAVDIGKPVKIGGKATDPTSLPAVVASGDRANALTSLQGEILVYLSRLVYGEDSTNSVMGTVWKPLAVNTYAPSLFTNYGTGATLNVKATAGNVFSVACHNSNASDRYIQLHDTATTPSTGAVPKLVFLIKTSSTTVIGSDFFTTSGIAFSNGIAFAFSTTEGTYTAGAAGEQNTTVVYK